MIGGRYPHLRHTRPGFAMGASRRVSPARVVAALAVVVALAVAAAELRLVG